MSTPARDPRRLAVGAAVNWLSFAATLAVSFATVPYFAERLGKATYGVWNVVENIIAYLTLLDLGVAACVTRYVARMAARRDTDGLSRIMSASVAVFTVAAGVGLAIAGIIAGAMGPFLASRAGVPGTLAPFVALMGVNLALTLVLGVFASALEGLERFALKGVIKIVALVVRTAGMVVALETGGGLWELGVALTLATLLEYAAYAVAARKLLPGARLSLSRVDRSTLREVRGYSVDAFLAMLAGRITVQTGGILIGVFLSMEDALYFLIGAKLVEMAKTLLRTATMTLTPAFSALEAQGRRDEMARLFLRATRVMLLLAVPVGVGMLVFGPAFLACWLKSDEFAAACYPALAILAVTLPVGIAQSAAARVLYGVGRLRRFARLALLESAVNLALSAALLPTLGPIGVAVAVALPNLAFCVCVIELARRELGVSRADYRRAWAGPAAGGLLLAACWLAVAHWAAPATWGPLAAAAALGAVPYALWAVWATGVLPRLGHAEQVRRVHRLEA